MGTPYHHLLKDVRSWRLESTARRLERAARQARQSGVGGSA